MGEFKFVCSACGQKISCDTSYCGKQIDCPACKVSLTVPAGTVPGVLLSAPSVTPPPAPPPSRAYAAPVAASAAATAALPTMAAAKPPARVPAAPEAPAKKPSAAASAKPKRLESYSALAVASFLLSLIMLAGAIPAIVCGHLALRRLRRNPFLKGQGLAVAGLIISYFTIVAAVSFAGTLYLIERHWRPLIVVRESAQDQAAVNSRVTDEVKPGDPASESEHALQSRGSAIYLRDKFLGRTVNGTGSFGYTMKVDPVRPMDVSCRFWGNEAQTNALVVLVENQVIGYQQIAWNAPGHFCDIEFKIPNKLTRGKDQVKVEFQGDNGRRVPTMYFCQMLRR